MANQERTSSSKNVLTKLGILTIAATVAIAACGTTTARPSNDQVTGERQSVLRDPANPSWSHNTVVVEAGARQSVLGDPDNPRWSHNTATLVAADGVDQRPPRPY
jgi:hypothetical protein